MLSAERVWGPEAQTAGEFCKNPKQGNPLVVQWLGLHALTAEGLGSIPGQGTQIPQAARLSQRKRKRLTYLLTIHQVYKEVDFQEAWMTWLMSVVT